MEECTKVLMLRTMDICKNALEFALEARKIRNETERWYLKIIREGLIGRLREAQHQVQRIETTTERDALMDQIQGHYAVKAYADAIKLHDKIVTWEDKFTAMGRELEVDKRKARGFATFPQKFSKLLTLDTRLVETALKILKDTKTDVCGIVFDQMHYFQQEHEDVDFGYDIPFPCGYEPPPKVTAVSMKVSASD